MKKPISILLSMLMILSCIQPLAMSTFAISKSDMPQNQNIELTSSTSYNISPGVVEEHIVTVDKNGNNQNKSYVAILDFSSGLVSAMAGYKDYDNTGKKWGMQTVRDQAKKAEEKTGRNVVVAINGDYYNMQTGAPLNNLVMQGVVVNQATDMNSYYFAVLKDGTPVIRSSTVPLTDVQEAVGSPFPLVLGGNNVTNTFDLSQMPRNAIGITAEGKVVVMVNDGRQAPKSVGYTLYELAEMMKAYGCVDAIYLDGGGSATYASKSEGTNELTVKNSPSDGNERLVSDTILFYSTAKPDGEFDHASVSPVDKLYTPYSTVQFTATGVDQAGAPANLPADGFFALEDDSYGTITADGEFVSNGKTGKVTVNYVSEEKTVGSSSIEIVVPDTLFVPSSEVSLGFEETTDFGLEAKYQNRDVAVKAADITWSITDEEGNDIGASVGSFSGLEFTSFEGETITCYVKAVLNHNDAVTTTIKTVIGAQPVVIYDFEYTTDAAEAEASNGELKYVPGYSMPRYDRSNPEAHAVQGAKFYEEGYPLYCWPNASLDDQDSMKATVVSKADGEPVRFGQKSLRIDFNYESYNGSSNSNNYLRAGCPDFKFDGTPTAIGMWMYVPEGVSNFLVYYQCGARMDDGNGNLAHGVTCFAPVCEINPDMYNKWTYLEYNLVTPPTGSSNGGMQNAPFGIQQGGGILWISFQVGNGKGDRSASRIYIDNYQVIYGTNTDDTTNPVINSIRTISGEQIEDGKTVLTKDTNTFVASYSDVVEKYATGIDFSEVRMSIDGIDVTDSCYNSEGDETIYLYDKKLSNGVHSIDVTVADKFGNTATETRYFTVEAENDETGVSLSPVGNPILGKDYVMEIVPTNSTVKEADISLKAISKFVSYWNKLSVVPGDNYELEDGYKYDSATDSIKFKAVKKADASSDDTVIARIIADIPNNIPENLECTYRITKGDITLDDGTKTSFSGKIVTTVLATYNISTSTMVVGSENAEIYVTDTVGNPASDVAVYTADGTPVGVTDENGVVTTSMFLNAAQKVTLYAEKDSGRSFNFTTQVFADGGNADGTPTVVKLNATTDNETMQNVSWMSSVVSSADKAVAKIAAKADYEANGEAALTEVEGTSAVTQFPSSGSIESNYAARINSVTFTGLKADTEYVYVVGDGEKMTEIKSFKTVKDNRAVNFFVIGDTQADDVTNTENITKALANSGVAYDFGVQTGDLVDNGGDYRMWEKIGSVISNDYTGAFDIVTALGNHEYYGDTNGEVANKYLALNGSDDTAPLCYSVTYGNVYFVVLNYANDGDYGKLLDWIKDDAAKSDAQWKILVTHQPAYYTNPGGTSEKVANDLRTIVDTVGFDVMLSGHDHSYARTLPMKGGEVDENGTTYFICGSTGEKSYTVIDNKAFNFEKLLGEGTEGTYNAIYLSVSTTDSELSITTYDCSTDGNSTVIDTFTKTKEICKNGLHTYTYTSDAYLKCSVCGYTVKADESDHTGMIKDAETGVAMYLISGVPQTSRWITNGDDYYYLGADGKALTGVQEVTDADGVTRTYTFDETGLNIAGSFVEEEVTNPANGEKRTITRYYFGGTYLRRWNEIDGATYYFYRTNNIVPVYNEGEMFTGTRTVKTSQKNTIRTFVFSEDGKLLVGALEDETDINGNYTGTRYYWGDNYMTDTTVDVNGFEYILDKNGYVTNKTDLASCKITLSATSGNYSGSAKKPTVTVKLGDKVLIKGQHYTVSYENNKEVGTAKVIVTGCKSVIGTKTLSYTIKPSKPTDLKTKVSGTSVVLTWTASKGASDYKVYRSTSLDGKYSELATVSGKTTYTDKTASPATTYYYKVRAYKAVDGKTYNSSYSDAVSSRIPLGNASGLKATATAYNKVKLTFNAVDGATGYAVYRSTSKDGKYSRIGTASKASYTDSTVKTGTKYYYKVRAFKTEVSSTEYSAYTSVVSAKTALSTVTGLKVSSTAYNKVTLKWTAVSGATSYAVYRSTSKNGTYKRIGTATKNSFSDTSVKTGAKYYYKVRAIIKVDKTNIYSAYSSAVSATPALAKATVKSVSASGKTVNIKWSKVSGASGYALYQASSKTGSLKRIKTVKSGSTTAFATKVSKSGTYYYVVKAYRTVGSKTVYGVASSRVSVKVR